MKEIDLFNQRLMSSNQLDLVQVENVQRIEAENKHLKYALAAFGVMLIAALIFSIHFHNKSADNNKKHK